MFQQQYKTCVSVNLTKHLICDIHYRWP